MRFRHSALLAIVFAILAPTLVPAQAQPSPTRPRTEDPKLLAKHHVASARTLHAQRKLPEALTELEAAYALDPQPGLLFAIGQLHVQLGECDLAIVFYRRFLATRPKPDQAAIAREAIDTCKTAAPASRLGSDKPVAVASIPITVAPLPPIAAAPAERPHRASHRGGYVVAGGLLATGVAASAGSLLLYRSSRAARSDAAMAGTYDQFAASIDRADRRRTEALIAGAAGLAALAGGVIAIVWTRHVNVAASPTTAGLEYRGSF